MPGQPGRPGFGAPQQGAAGQPFGQGQGNMPQQFIQPQGQPQMKPQVNPQAPKFDPSDHTADFDEEDIKENKLIAALPYFFFFLGVIVCSLHKESKFARFHMMNAIKLEIASILALLPCIIVIPGVFVTAVFEFIIIIAYIAAIVNVFKGKAKDPIGVRKIKFLM